MIQHKSFTPFVRRVSMLVVALAILALGLGVNSASAHTFSAKGECGVSNLKWTSFAGSGSKPVNKPLWKVTSGAANVASGQASFTGGSYNLEVSIPSTNGSYDASSTWTNTESRDGHAGSGRSQFTLKSCDEITTTASAGVEVGGKIWDTAYLSGATDDAAGTIEFELFAGNDTNCESVLTSSSVPVSGNGEYKSADFTATTAGDFQWTATYSGDAKNDPVGPHGCGVAEERVTVTEKPVPPAKSKPEISTVASRSVVVGKPVHDTAALTGGTDDISGTIQFQLYRDSDENCANRIFSSTVKVDGNGNYVSGSTRPVRAGGYQWTATYSGDDKNEAVGPEGCDEASEHVVVRKKPRIEVKSVCRVNGARLKISGPTGNVRSPFKLRIRSAGYTRITTYVDGRVVNSIRNGKVEPRTFTVRINPRRMAPGVHRVMVTANSGPQRCASTRRGLKFVRALPGNNSPSFTG